MSDENPTPETTEEDKRVPYERFEQVNKKARENADRASAVEKQLSELQAQMQEREEAGLPELDRERKRAEALEKRVTDAENRALAAEESVQSSRREQWIVAAAAAQGFANPAKAHKMLDDLGSIEDATQAERAVKNLAKSDAYLLKAEDATLPGRVLENGKPPAEKPADGAQDKAGLGRELLANMLGDRQ